MSEPVHTPHPKDADREAFEKWAEGEGYRVKKITRPYYGEIYTDEPTHHLWKGWQAAHDHYAPKLSEQEAVEIACREFTKPDADGNLWDQTPENFAIKFHITSKYLMRQSMARALRAAGVRFKKEA